MSEEQVIQVQDPPAWVFAHLIWLPAKQLLIKRTCMLQTKSQFKQALQRRKSMPGIPGHHSDRIYFFKNSNHIADTLSLCWLCSRVPWRILAWLTCLRCLQYSRTVPACFLMCLSQSGHWRYTGGWRSKLENVIHMCKATGGKRHGNLLACPSGNQNCLNLQGWACDTSELLCWCFVLSLENGTKETGLERMNVE